jgi:hypothetical protein
VSGEEHYTPAPPADFILPFDLPNARPARAASCGSTRVGARARARMRCPKRRRAWRRRPACLARAARFRAEARRPADGADQKRRPLDLVTADYYGADDGSSLPACAALRGSTRRGSRRWKTRRLPSALAGAGSSASPSSRGKAAELSGHRLAGTGRDRGVGGSLFRPVRAIADRHPPGGRALYEPGKRGPALARGRGDAAGDARRPRRCRRLGAARAFLATLEDIELVDTAAGGNGCCGGCSTKTKCACIPRSPMVFRCDCEPARIASVLRSYSPAERTASPIPTASSVPAANFVVRFTPSAPPTSPTAD